MTTSLIKTAAHIGALHIAAAITAWDKKDADALIEMLQSLEEFCYANELDSDNYVDLAHLPSAAIPTDVDTGYPIWAMDVDDNLITGQSIAELSTLPLAEYRADRAED
jgi:hypothetical protein